VRITEALERATSRRDDGPDDGAEPWTDEQFLEVREHDLRERTVPVGRVIVATVGCLALAALLTSAKLVEIAERQPFGSGRDRALDAAEAVDRVANFFSLNRPYDAIQDLRGTGDRAGQQVETIDEVAEEIDPPPTPVPPPSTSAAQAATSTVVPTTTAAPPPAIRRVAPSSPLRVHVVGDSQAEFLARQLAAG